MLEGTPELVENDVNVLPLQGESNPWSVQVITPVPKFFVGAPDFE
jgi:hypothetical protein